ncbi:hypothetical protein B0H17DRAFT_1136560 [Mycena rosella]|uniref:Uncharacterized protein n=1 Tax=Mycena rosella TaxID=1033263 RepID=A0AAD7GBS3_MYCRO|nr:hypothetical protein B0H17DRAFT_1136560 [Mycena rosella]
MVRTFTLFLAAVAASCVSAVPLDARHKGHPRPTPTAKAGSGVTPPAGARAVAVATVDTLYARHRGHKAGGSPTAKAGGGSPTAKAGASPTARAIETVDISALVAAASASAASVQAAAITTAAPGEAFGSPEFQGEEAGLQLKLELDTEAGDTAAAAQDQVDLDALNEGAGGGF